MEDDAIGQVSCAQIIPFSFTSLRGRTRGSVSDRQSWTYRKQEAKHILDAFKSFDGRSG